MQVRFIGDVKRTNSFGTFEPGKLYDVSDRVGEQLLTAPTLFQPKDAPPADKAADRIIEVDEHANGGEYKSINMTTLRSMCRKRGVPLRRDMRRVDIIGLLQAEDAKTTDVVNKNPAKIGDMVLYGNEKEPCKITNILSDTMVTIQDVNNKEWDIKTADLTTYSEDPKDKVEG